MSYRRVALEAISTLALRHYRHWYCVYNEHRTGVKKQKRS